MPVSVTVKMRSSGYVAQVVKPMVKANLTPKIRRATNAVVQAAPSRETGNMKRNIRMYARDGAGRFSRQTGRNPAIVSYEVAVEVPYAQYVIRGTRGPYPIVSHGPWPLRNRFTGQVFGRSVMHPGIRANDFVTRAMKASGF